MTIYQDTRPRLLEQGSATPSETSHPLIYLCSELKDADRRMAERFLCNAEAGVTPEQFYSQLANTKAPDSGDNGQEETNEDSTQQVSQDEDDNDDMTVGGYGEEEEENEPPPAGMPPKENSRRDKQSSKPLREQNNIEKSKRGARRTVTTRLQSVPERKAMEAVVIVVEKN